MPAKKVSRLLQRSLGLPRRNRQKKQRYVRKGKSTIGASMDFWAALAVAPSANMDQRLQLVFGREVQRAFQINVQSNRQTALLLPFCTIVE